WPLSLPSGSGHTRPVTAIAFSDDGARIATSSDDGTAVVWDAASSAETLTFLLPGSPYSVSVAFTRDGSGVTSLTESGPTDKLSVWNLSSRKKLLDVPGHGEILTNDGTRIVVRGLD